MRPVLLRGGRLVDPSQGYDGMGDVLVKEGIIAWSVEGPLPSEYDVLSAEGLVVCPGFIDLHCHLREPGFEDKETIATGSRAAARGGFTTICCMPNTNPPLDTPITIGVVKAIAARDSLIRVLPIACVSAGRRGQELTDMPSLASAGAIAFSDDGQPVANSRLMRRSLEIARELDLPVIDHCEDTELARGGYMNEGGLSRRLGISGMPAEAEEIMVARDVALARLTGSHMHVAHASTAGSVELIRRAKDRGTRVTAEVTPHHLTLTEEAVETRGAMAKVNPPLRTQRDVEALVEGLRDGAIDIIATDHAPHTAAEKSGPFEAAAFGISGFETALGSLMSLVHAGKISLSIVIAALTMRPARLLKEAHRGTLAAGSIADITVFDPNGEWVVEPARFASKGRNTPLAGTKLKGKVMATICGGRVAYQDESIKLVAGSAKGIRP